MSSAESLPSKVGYVRLGQSGLKVSKIILGCMSYGSSKWQDWVLDEEESLKHFKAAWEMGINTWDTANVYSNGESEVLVGKAIKELKIPRDEIVVLTKVYMTVGKTVDVPINAANPDENGYVNLHGLSRKHIFDSIKASLKRMDLEYVDMLQCHRFDYDTPIEETMDALHDVVKAGYARYIGMSSCYAYQFHAMQNYAKSKNQTMFVSMQDFYNPVYREEEKEMFPTCKLFGAGVIPWSPLARGYLTRPHSDQSTTRAKTDKNMSRFVGLGSSDAAPLEAINEKVEEISKARGLSMAQVALAWVLAQPAITAPIVGTTKLESLKELVQATHVKLTEDEIKAIAEPYRPRPTMGHT
ncbi:aryl-alcohol dehydrogenase [Pseudohyphozyma bogoriensis]|nr:aryl-alcohol dehydrogenase [Pseudohyphozyma bogoriensis]